MKSLFLFFYFGTEYACHSRYLKSVSLGLEGSINRNLQRDRMAQGIAVDVSQYAGQSRDEWSKDQYFNKNYSIGLRIGVSIWK